MAQTSLSASPLSQKHVKKSTSPERKAGRTNKRNGGITRWTWLEFDTQEIVQEGILMMYECYLQTGRFFSAGIHPHQHTHKHTLSTSLCSLPPLGSIIILISINIRLSLFFLFSSLPSLPPSLFALFLGHLLSSALTEIFQLSYIHSLDTHTHRDVNTHTYFLRHCSNASDSVLNGLSRSVKADIDIVRLHAQNATFS